MDRNKMNRLEVENRMLVGEVRYAAEILGAVVGVFEPTSSARQHIVNAVERIETVTKG
tara:strand:+ start:854 stop:1027 length:174 start_codon:yes stop_codon:yes gene_type:complete